MHAWNEFAYLFNSHSNVHISSKNLFIYIVLYNDFPYPGVFFQPDEKVSILRKFQGVGNVFAGTRLFQDDIVRDISIFTNFTI